MTRFCSACGDPNDHTENFCTSCGVELDPLETSSSTHQTTPVSPTHQSSQSQSVIHKQPKKLYRCDYDTVVGGVCAGIAEYAELDINLVRIITIIATLFSGGTVAIAYFIVWAILPIEPFELHNSRKSSQSSLK